MHSRRKCSAELHLHCICTTKLLFGKNVRRNYIYIAFAQQNFFSEKVFDGTVFALHLVTNWDVWSAEVHLHCILWQFWSSPKTWPVEVYLHRFSFSNEVSIFYLCSNVQFDLRGDGVATWIIFYSIEHCAARPFQYPWISCVEAVTQPKNKKKENKQTHMHIGSSNVQAT